MKNPLSPIFNYFSASKAELEKVSWPTQKDVTRYTVMVVAVSVVMALFFAGMDFGLSKAVQSIIPKSTTPTAAPAAPITPDIQVNDVNVVTSTSSN